MTMQIARRSSVMISAALIFVAGCLFGIHLPSAKIVRAATSAEGNVPKSYGRLVAAIADRPARDRVGGLLAFAQAAQHGSGKERVVEED